MTNLCRDEVTTMLKDKIEAVFGSSFNTNGLGAVLTCGVTGIRAGLSHSPVATDDGRERYVFFSFPHIAIDDAGNLGAIYRPNRPGTSCACGALAKALSELQGEGLSRNVKIPGVHDPLDPEYTILKQRLARRVQYESQDPRRMDLAGLTSLAERVITDVSRYKKVLTCGLPARFFFLARAPARRPLTPPLPPPTSKRNNPQQQRKTNRTSSTSSRSASTPSAPTLPWSQGCRSTTGAGAVSRRPTSSLLRPRRSTS
jgi:hypothetical protein